MKTLEVRDEQIICIDEQGRVVLRPNSPYYNLRYFDFNDGRIEYKFSDTASVQETYDDRIFNCVYDGRRFQFRQDLSDELAEAIQSHKKSGSMDRYKYLFLHAVNERPDVRLLNYYLSDMTEVRDDGYGYIIHNMFRVDGHGNAYHWAVNGWRPICVVMQGDREGEQHLVNKEGHAVNVNDITMTIIAKVLFFANPNLEDKVFTSQLYDGEEAMLREKLGLVDIEASRR